MLADLLSQPTQALILFIIFVVSISFHEYSHAWATNHFGLATGETKKRLTLNPFAHFEITGIIAFLLAGTGWGKPVPISTKKRASWSLLRVAAIGPLSNIFLAIICAFLLQIILLISFTYFYDTGTISSYLMLALQLNLSLALVNLLPIYPFDGSYLYRTFIVNDKSTRAMQIGSAVLLLLIVLAQSFNFIDVLGPLSLLVAQLSDYLLNFTSNMIGLS